MTRRDRARDATDLRGRTAQLRGRVEWYTVLGVEHYACGRAVVLRRWSDNAELRAYWSEVTLTPGRAA